MAAYTNRIIALTGRLKPSEGFLVTNIKNVKYLTGFKGSNGYVLASAVGAFFMTDFRYEEQAREEVDGVFDIIYLKKNLIALLGRLIKKTKMKTLLVESSVSYEAYKRLSVFDLRVVSGAVEKLRAKKDAEEIALIEEAVRRAEGAFLDVRPHIKTGAKETSIVLRLEERLKRRGCKRIPFDIIVASGANSAKPHASATERKIAPGDLVVIDWGGEAGGYFSDMTRTLFARGGNDNRKEEIYRLVHKANRSGIRYAAEGGLAGEVDNAVRDVIKKGGYGNCFGHGTGHGVGLDVHEKPNLRKRCKERLLNGMVFTIEPGIYIPGLGGVRIEDMVAVEAGGVRVLTSLPKDIAGNSII